MANPFLARGRVSRHANFKRPPLSRWGPGWPVNHNTDTLPSVPFFAHFDINRTTAQVLQKNLILNTCTRSVGGKAQFFY